jgi:hypothetical protein
MKTSVTFTNCLLLFLIIVVIWLAIQVGMMSDRGYVLMPNSDSGYMVIETKFGNFPISITKTKPVKDGTEISLTVINPLVIHFGDAKVSVNVRGSVESARLNLAPSVNTTKLTVPSLERGETIEVSLELDKIYFK